MVKYDLLFEHRRIKREIEGELPREGEFYELVDEGIPKTFRVLEVWHHLVLNSIRRENSQSLTYKVYLSPLV